jgi:ribonuclease H / adenosylcobalamin/alpha-ribazole phosphatase
MGTATGSPVLAAAPAWPATCCGWLLRHGESDGNATGRVQGQTGGTGLSARGREQVTAAAAAVRRGPLRPVAVVSSDLQRCRETAGVLAGALDLPVSWDADLRERSFGVLEGRSWDDVPGAAVGVVGGVVVDAGVRPPGGESVADLTARVARALGRAARLGGPVLVVTSGGPVRVATAPGPPAGMPWAPVRHATPFAVCLRRFADRPAPSPGRPLPATIS